MKVKTTLRKLMDTQFQETLQRVMRKWPEAKDVHALVKIAQAFDDEHRAYQAIMMKLEQDVGYPVDEERKSTNSKEISDYLLRLYGKFLPDGNMTIAGATDQDTEEFLKQKSLADACIRSFNEKFNEVMEKEFEFEIPRQILVDDKHLRKEVITAHDCYILEPILDLSKVSDLKAEPTQE